MCRPRARVRGRRLTLVGKYEDLVSRGIPIGFLPFSGTEVTQWTLVPYVGFHYLRRAPVAATTSMLTIPAMACALFIGPISICWGSQFDRVSGIRSLVLKFLPLDGRRPRRGERASGI